MELNTEQYQELHCVLLNAFSNKSTLKQMVRFKLGVRLEVIAGGENLSDIIFNLIEWAECEGKLQELITGAYQENPGNFKLKTFYEKLLGLQKAETLIKQESSMTLTKLQQERLKHQQIALQEQWQLMMEKLRQLRNNYVIQSGTSIKFQLDQEIKAEENKLLELEQKIDKIEQTLKFSEISLHTNVLIDDLIQQVRSQCCDKIQNLYSKIQLLNLEQINVDELYVDVHILEKLSSKTYATIPELLKNSDLYNDFDRYGLGQPHGRHDGFEVAQKNHRLMILGKPGSGKSTFIRHLAFACCQGRFQSDKIPILIELRRIENYSSFNLLNIIHQEFGLSNLEETKQILSRGKVLIFLDGLDETSSNLRKNIQNNIDEFSRDTQFYRNSFILTCRISTTEYNLDAFKYIEIADFNPEQVEKFAENWFTVSAKDSEHGKTLTSQFLSNLKLSENKSIAELAVTPILLSLICWIYSDSQNFPTKRSELYQEGIKLLLSKWDENKNIQRDLGSEYYRNLSPEDKKKLLSYIANCKFEQEQFTLFDEDELESYITRYDHNFADENNKAVIKAIEAQHGLLIERLHGIYSFSHLTFQEYFTAEYIVGNGQIEKLVKKYLIDTHWREVFLLVAELMGNNAGKLLSLMQKEAQTYIFDMPKLQALLCWADEITSGTAGNLKPANKRAIALTIAHCDAYRDTYSYAYAVGYTIAVNNTIINNNKMNDSSDRLINTILGYTDSINEAIEGILELTKLEVFNNTEFIQLADKLENLKPKIPNEKHRIQEHISFSKQLEDTLLFAFNLTPELINLSNKEMEILDDKYFYANKLIINCKKAVFAETSPLWWTEIEEIMLKPNL